MSKGILLPVSVILLTSAFLVFHWLTVASVTPSPLELVSSEADMWVGLDSGLGMVVRIKNRSDAPVELESLQAEMGCRAETLTIRSPANSPLRRVEYRGPECFRVSSEITADGLRASLRVTATPEAGEWEDRPKEISFQVMTESGCHAVLIPCHFF